MITALDDRDSLLQGLEAGADDFLRKPVDRHELAARVRTITRLNRYHTLVEQRETLRKMAERMVTAQEEERQRISRELHDDLGQALTTHLLSLRDLQSDLTLPVEVLFERMQSLYEQSYEISIKIRRLAHDLRPPVLDALGLKIAMQTYCTEFTRRTRLPIDLVIDPALPLLPDIYNVTIYRALQEALNNIVKHAQATQVWVELSVEDALLSLTIQDNGKGFSEERQQSNGIGLSGLQERLMIAGGKLNIESSPNMGTILTVELPLPTKQTTGSKS
jgi:signal transduction histidine kinase